MRHYSSLCGTPHLRALRMKLAVFAMLASFQSLALAQGKDRLVEQSTIYRSTPIDGLSIFCREAGPKDAPTILLLHGLASSSRMFEPLLARLSDRYHLVAPDYPGFGHSDWPDPKKFAYTFDHIAEIMNHFTEALALSRYSSTCRITAALWVFAWPWSIRNGSRLSSSRTPCCTTKTWGRTGRHGGPFGPIALPTKARFAAISCRCRRRGAPCRERPQRGTL